jgi:hypothetical protein
MMGAEPAPETLCFCNLWRWEKSKNVVLSIKLSYIKLGSSTTNVTNMNINNFKTTEGTEYKLFIEVLWNGSTSQPNFVKIYQEVQKLLVGDTQKYTQTDWWFYKPIFIFGKEAKNPNQLLISAHLTNSNLNNFKMIEAMGLEITASRSPWMALPPNQIS